MPHANTDRLRDIKTLSQLVTYLRDELDWPITSDKPEEAIFTYVPEDLGLNDKEAAKVDKIHQLRPLTGGQPWGIFFVEFESKKLPVVVLRRILSHLVIKRRSVANKAQSAAWNVADLLFISAFGDENTDQREIAFAHFHQEQGDLPTLRVLGWDGGDAPLKLDYVAATLHDKLHWPGKTTDQAAWRNQWSSAFRHRIGHSIRTSDKLAEVLASLARGIRDSCRVMMSSESERGPLTKLYKAFQSALIHDLTEDGFADTYAQTITYGLLTAAISRTDMSAGRHGTALFAENVADIVPVTNPFLKEMLQAFLKLGGSKNGINFDELGIQDVVELLRGDETDLPAILRDFGNKTQGEDPVIHFYEHFLSAYDKPEKKKRGVFYTPQPVVSYIVRSVHELLQTEFGLEDGLASTITWGEMLKKLPALKLPPLTDEHGENRAISPDEPFVQILDPATGTATFLVEVIEVIWRHLKAKWDKGGHKVMPVLPPTSFYRIPSTFADYWNQYVSLSLLRRLHGYELLMAPYAIAHMKIGLKLFETGYRFGSEERARIYLTNALEPWLKQIPLIGYDALAHEAEAVNKIKRHKRFTVIIGNPPYSGESANDIPWVRNLVKSKYEYIEGTKIFEKGKKNWLLNDYVKFMRVAHFMTELCQLAIIGLITPHSFLDNPTYRAMRYALINDFQFLFMLDLHGNSDKREKCPDGSKDENVFDITQGVSISIFIRNKTSDPVAKSKGKVYLSELWGLRNSNKYSWLLKNTCQPHQSLQVRPDERFYFFKHGGARDAEYESWWPINTLFQVNGNGVITAHDDFSIAFDDNELAERLDTYINPRLTDGEVLERLKLRENSMWKIGDARASLRRARKEDRFIDVLYRPFDIRRTFFHKSVIFNLRLPVMKHMVAGKNVALICSRMTKGETFAHAFVSRAISEAILLSSKTSNNAFSFPAVLMREDGEADLFCASPDSFQSNFSPAFLNELFGQLQPDGNIKTVIQPDEVFNYLYSLLHSPAYRSRYAEFLKRDFPRLPVTGNLELLRELARLGSELVALHLLESPKLNKLATKYVGGKNPVLERIIWSGDTVWLDKAQTKGFAGVPEGVWNFYIGGYQVCRKWLDDRRKADRALSPEDIARYQKIVVALSETIRLMAEIDQVIAAHGGWPGAFAAK